MLLTIALLCIESISTQNYFTTLKHLIKGKRELSRDVTPDELAGTPDTFEAMHKVDFLSTESDFDFDIMEYTPAEQLTTFVWKLKGFVHDSVFDALGFESNVKELHIELLKIAKNVKMLVNHEPELLDQLSFASRMFETMYDSIGMFKNIESLQPPGRELVWAVVDLNVRLWALYSTKGSPDISMDGYAIRVYLHGELLNHLRGKTKEAASLPFSTQIMLSNQIIQVTNILKSLSVPQFVQTQFISQRSCKSVCCEFIAMFNRMHSWLP
ncbi:hypothetical protein JCM33374_g5279 [Metschnikowia sp. JCM 33374]|nr:hypothetical protein JCM33374_g5279 [Metschnikowia sp. JCM 33374]